MKAYFNLGFITSALSYIVKAYLNLFKLSNASPYYEIFIFK